jgi:hypothetical protein
MSSFSWFSSCFFNVGQLMDFDADLPLSDGLDQAFV